MSGRYGTVRRPAPVPDYELNTSLNYQIVFVKYDEGDEEFERLQLFEERVGEAVAAGFMPVGAPVTMRDKYSNYYLIQGAIKTGSRNTMVNGNNNNNNPTTNESTQGGGKRKTRRNRRS